MREVNEEPAVGSIPSEELTLLWYANAEARDLAQQGRPAEGREALGRGLRQALDMRGEPWGEALLWLWIKTLKRYDVRRP
jgi:hypothetical protein